MAEHAPTPGAPTYVHELSIVVATRALADADVDCLLLKGASFAQWLYDDGSRTSVDVDLLVRHRDLDRAATALSESDWVRTGLVDDEVEHHAVAWRHPILQTVDLHHTLVGVGVDHDTLWRAFTADRVVIPVRGEDVDVLGAAARCLHVALHLAQDSHAREKKQRDLRLALAKEDLEVWRNAAALADTLEATAAFVAGLRTQERGRAVADALGLRPRSDVEVALRLGGDRSGAVALHRWRRRSPAARMGEVWRRLWPSGDFLRDWWPPAARGPGWMVVARFRRMAWVLARLPGAARALRRASGSVEE